jgi:hypothetical protein
MENHDLGGHRNDGLGAGPLEVAQLSGASEGLRQPAASAPTEAQTESWAVARLSQVSGNATIVRAGVGAIACGSVSGAAAHMVTAERFANK